MKKRKIETAYEYVCTHASKPEALKEKQHEKKRKNETRRKKSQDKKQQKTNINGTRW